MDSTLLAKIPEIKTNRPSNVAVTGNNNIEKYRKYVALHPANYPEKRFLIYLSKEIVTNKLTESTN